MSAIVASRPKRRRYEIILASSDITSWYGTDAWNCDYIINLNQIMDDEEQHRPYLMTFSMTTTSSALLIGAPAQPPIMLQVLWNGVPPHVYQYRHIYVPSGYLQYSYDQSANPSTSAYINTKYTDNAPVYIHSIRGTSNIGIRFINLNGAGVSYAVDYLLTLYLEPADF